MRLDSTYSARKHSRKEPRLNTACQMVWSRYSDSVARPRFWNIWERTLASKALEITARFGDSDAMAVCMAASPPEMTCETCATAWLWVAKKVSGSRYWESTAISV